MMILQYGQCISFAIIVYPYTDNTFLSDLGGKVGRGGEGKGGRESVVTNR